MKRVLSHFERCGHVQCSNCRTLKALAAEVQAHVANLNDARMKNEPSDLYMRSYYEDKDPSYPMRKTSFSGSFGEMSTSYSGMDRYKQDFSLDLDDPISFTSVPNEGLFGDNPEVFPLESPQPSTMTGSHVSNASAFKLGTSLFETFDPFEIESYLKAVRGSDTFPTKPDETLKEKICAVCLQGEQVFQPIQLYCDCCFSRIKRGGMYWKLIPEAKLQICACQKCYSSRKNGTLMVGQLSMSQHAFTPCKNDECVTETWVACDKCGYWIHSSCGLFNRGENNDDAKYMCPFCLKEEMESGHRRKVDPKPISMWGACELAICPLSDFIQRQVNHRVHDEIEKIKFPKTVQPLTVRVLMSVKKVTKVQPVLASAFDLRKEYPYRQKVIGVFQKIHGVDVLLFCMYVQEYGDDCPKPNSQWVNLEYIDSVKHFTPDVRTINRESLRSVVYQETLLAYIEFVKKRGFEVFYIWACPPGKDGGDYILHCKPKSQRIPTPDRLRLWYKDLLKTAKERGTVTHDSNLMDTFFTCGLDRVAGKSFSAEEMPYFEGDYWPGEAEKILKALGNNKAAECCRKLGEKRKTRGEMSLNETLENGLLASLPFPRWSDFMVWHLQEPCSLCSNYIKRGYKYVFHFHTNGKVIEPVKKRAHFEGIKLGRPNGTNSNPQFFQVCERCYRVCEAIGPSGPIPECIDLKELKKEEVMPVTSSAGNFNNSEDGRYSEIFESRQAFLAFCKGNHYQFDTLQHAKHSTMMLLYHLHNTTAPVFPTICHGCGLEIPANDTKKDNRQFEYCSQCRTAGMIHQIPGRNMTNVPYSMDTSAQLGRFAETFEHTAYCNVSDCWYPDCSRMKDLFKHAWQCRVRVFAFGCILTVFLGGSRRRLQNVPFLCIVYETSFAFLQRFVLCP